MFFTSQNFKCLHVTYYFDLLWLTLVNILFELWFLTAFMKYTYIHNPMETNNERRTKRNTLTRASEAIFFTWKALWVLKLALRTWPVLFTLNFFLTLFSYVAKWKIKSCCNHCFSQEIRPLTTIQLGILQGYSSVRIGFNMNHKCCTLPIVYTILV